MKTNWQKVYPTIWSRAIKVLKNNGVVVLPTDTIYGIVASVDSKTAVERIYEIKGRDSSKPFIVLITSYNDLQKFGVKLNVFQAKFLEKIWPGKVSVILPCLTKKFRYLHRGTKSIAFRMISKRNKNLYNLINKVGPLVAPSANPVGSSNADTISEAKKYFGKKIDLYISAGRRKQNPSTLIKLENNNFVVLRQGEKKIK